MEEKEGLIKKILNISLTYIGIFGGLAIFKFWDNFKEELRLEIFLKGIILVYITAFVIHITKNYILYKKLYQEQLNLYDNKVEDNVKVTNLYYQKQQEIKEEKKVSEFYQKVLAETFQVLIVYMGADKIEQKQISKKITEQLVTSMNGGIISAKTKSSKNSK